PGTNPRRTNTDLNNLHMHPAVRQRRNKRNRSRITRRGNINSEIQGVIVRSGILMRQRLPHASRKHRLTAKLRPNTQTFTLELFITQRGTLRLNEVLRNTNPEPRISGPPHFRIVRVRIIRGRPLHIGKTRIIASNRSLTNTSPNLRLRHSRRRRIPKLRITMNRPSRHGRHEGSHHLPLESERLIKINSVTSDAAPRLQRTRHELQRRSLFSLNRLFTISAANTRH